MALASLNSSMPLAEEEPKLMRAPRLNTSSDINLRSGLATAGTEDHSCGG